MTKLENLLNQRKRKQRKNKYNEIKKFRKEFFKYIKNAKKIAFNEIKIINIRIIEFSSFPYNRIPPSIKRHIVINMTIRRFKNIGIELSYDPLKDNFYFFPDRIAEV